MNLKEIRVQVALGTIPEELRMPFLRGEEPEIAEDNRRKCKICKGKILKGTKFYRCGCYEMSFNICNDCSYMSVVQMIKNADKK